MDMMKPDIPRKRQKKMKQRVLLRTNKNNILKLVGNYYKYLIFDFP